MRRLIIALALLGASGCAHVLRDNVVGPRGENLIELSCTQLSGCYDLARQECRGDFEVVQTGVVVPPVREDLVSSSQDMLVRCRPAVALAAPQGACTTDAQCPASQYCYTGADTSGLCLDRPAAP